MNNNARHHDTTPAADLPAVDFYFDFSSPYGYIASERIEAVAAAHGRRVHWHPLLLGVVFQSTGGAPLVNVPLKGQYHEHDFLRSARLHGVEFHRPSRFPVSGVAATRLFYWLQQHSPVLAVALAQALYRAFFIHDIDIANPEQALRVFDDLRQSTPAPFEQASSAGHALTLDAARTGMGSAEIKQRSRSETEAAMARGVFGSPFFLVDGEAFWGLDRLDQVARWMQQAW
jgi:2-hydroxychromene-2-carboxylate isomerase